MREILFKGKRKNNGKWIEGGYAEHDGKVFIVTWVRYIPDTRDWDEADYYENNPHYNSVLIEVIPETVCQYTELKDKCGRKIFDNDLIGCNMNCVEMLNGEWCVNGDRPLFFMAKEFEVAGNKFDNTEPIK